MINTVFLAWVLVVALLVALPALAWWVGARDVWSRPSKRTEPDLYREMVRRHALRPAEAAQVEGAVTWGRELPDPRLRAAVVDWAVSLQRMAAQRRAGHPRARQLGRLLCGSWLVLGTGALVFQLVHGNWRGLLDALIWPLVWAYPGYRVATAQRRAIRLNAGAPASAAPGTGGAQRE